MCVCVWTYSLLCVARGLGIVCLGSPLASAGWSTSEWVDGCVIYSTR